MIPFLPDLTTSPDRPMLHVRFVHPAPTPIGLTVERLADGQYLDGEGWSKAEPRPMPLARDAAPAQDRARLDLVTDGWPSGDYAVTVWSLAADGAPTSIVGLVGYTVPEPLPEVHVSLGVAGR